MKKADYEKIAELYDKGRSLPDHITGLWMDIIKRYSGAQEGAKVLDLGCGTGRFTIVMANELRYRMVGADSSEAMLIKARGKDTTKSITWDCLDAQNLTYTDKTFDVVFMSHLLHHVDSPAKVISESKRVLKDSGAILVRYGPMEYIRNDVEHTFFFEVLDIDEPRTLTIETVEKLLSDAGFSGIRTEVIKQQTYNNSAAHLESIRNKHTSVMTMISQESYEQGLKKLSEYIEENRDDPWLLHDSIAITAGYKGE